ncbi:RNI-like protein [Daedaleopsis nitida]|nr:RNI-like protein [Daedaleopsis nitida]
MEHAYVDELPSDEESCYYAEHIVFHPDPTRPSLLPTLTTTSRKSSLTARASRPQNAPGLTYLDISGCTEVTGLGLHAIATHSTSLTSLYIGRIPGVTDPTVAALVRGLPHLEVLEMDNLPLITAVAVRDVWTFARGLKHWTLSGCMHITDGGFPWVPGLQANQERRRTWMESLPPLVLPGTHQLDKLRVLDLSHCLRLTDAAVLGIVAHAPRIHNLNLAGCIELTDRALEAVCALGRHLRIVDVGGLERVTDRGVFALASACTHLQSVDVSFITRLTDLVVLELASLPRLQTLGVAGLPRLTDHAMFFAAEHAFELEELHLSYCIGLTLDGVRAVLRRLAKLEHISLSGVPAMKRRGVRRFSDGCPEGYDERKQGIWRVFRAQNIRALGGFLEKEQWRRREAERANVLFDPRGDDSRELY